MTPYIQIQPIVTVSDDFQYKKVLFVTVTDFPCN